MEDLRFTICERVSGKERHITSVVGVSDIVDSMFNAHDPDQVDALQRLRHENELHGHSKEYKRIKREELKCFCPAGVLVNDHGKERVTDYSGWVQMDIDEGDNPGMTANDLKSILPTLIPSCFYICSSSGGGGVVAYIRTTANDETTYKATARAIIATLAVNGIKTDKTTDQPTRLRFVTMDENPYRNAEAPVLSLPSEVIAYFANGIQDKTPKTTPATAKHEQPDGLATTRKQVKIVSVPTCKNRRFKAALRAIAKNGIDIAPDDNDYWKLIVSLKSAANSGIFDNYDGLQILLFLSKFWTNPKNEAWATTEKNARRKWETCTGYSGRGLRALHGFYFLCHQHEKLKDL